MRAILSFTTILAVGLAIPTTDQDGWAEFKAKFGKVYSDPQEDLMRKGLFLNATAKVEEHNARFAAGLTTYDIALNHLSDMTRDEINAKSKGLILPETEKMKIFHEPTGEAVPSTVDWIKQGAVTPVKNQGICGSCYAFSAVGSLEGLLAIKTKNLVSLSEQEVVDCRFDGCHGCGGGWPSAVFDDLNKKSLLHPSDPKGLETEANYPYRGVDGTCAYSPSESSGTDVGHKAVPASEDALQEAVANVGPISVAIYTNDNFDMYTSGVYNDPSCSPNQRPNHGVLVVGYGTENGQAYWLVKNSWGPNWGDEGYIKMARNAGNICGIANFAAYPIV